MLSPSVCAGTLQVLRANISTIVSVLNLDSELDLNLDVDAARRGVSPLNANQAQAYHRRCCPRPCQDSACGTGVSIMTTSPAREPSPSCEPLRRFCSPYRVRRSGALEGGGPLLHAFGKAILNSEFLHPRARERFTFLLDHRNRRAGISRGEAPWSVFVAPGAGVLKHAQPRGRLQRSFPVFRHPWPLPLQKRTLGVRHHN